MSDDRTIIALKTNFLRQQIRILSQPLRLSDKAKERAGLSDAEIRNVMTQVNQFLRRHTTSVFDRVAISNVSAQIEKILWSSSEPEDLLANELDDSDFILRSGDDLTASPNIAKLPLSFPEDEQTHDFKKQLKNLQALDEKRAKLQREMDQYRALQKMIEPLRDPQGRIQPNLATRDGALGEELGKMRGLGIRVAGGVARGNERGEMASGAGAEDEDEDIVTVDERERVNGVLGLG